MLTIKERNGYDFILDLSSRGICAHVHSNTTGEDSKVIPIPLNVYNYLRGYFGPDTTATWDRRPIKDIEDKSGGVKYEMYNFFELLSQIMDEMMHT